MAKAACTATTKAGKPCQAVPRNDTGLCNAHSPKEIQQSSGFGGAQPGAGRPKLPGAVELLRDRLEARVDEVLDPLFAALTAERAVVVGQTKDAYVDYVTDWSARLAAVRELLDRAYGKPKQQTEISGPDDGPVMIASTFDLSKLTVEEKRDLLELLEKTGG